MADAATTTEEVTLTEDEQAFAKGLGEETAEDTPETEAESEEEGEPEKPAVETEEEAEKPVDKPEGEEEGEETEEEESEEVQPENRRNRRGFAERQALKGSVTTELDKLIVPTNAKELVENKGMDPVEAEIEAMRLDMQRRDNIANLTELNAGIQTDADNVTEEFPIFDEASPDYDKEFTEKTRALWQKAANYTTAKENPNVAIRADLPLYEFFAFAAEARNAGSKAGEARGEAKGQKAAEKMLSEADIEPSGSQNEPLIPDEDALFLKGLTGKA